MTAKPATERPATPTQLRSLLIGVVAFATTACAIAAHPGLLA